MLDSRIVVVSLPGNVPFGYNTPEITMDPPPCSTVGQVFFSLNFALCSPNTPFGQIVEFEPHQFTGPVSTSIQACLDFLL